MTCEHLNFSGGGHAIICGGRAARIYCACGRPGKFVCDWKVSHTKSGTCDAPICERCTLEVEPLKHLCTEHQKAFESWKHRHPGVNIIALRSHTPQSSSLQLGLFSQESSEEPS